jgi:hypothetical protein
MYAQLILKSLEFLDTIDEVRDELKILPTDLDDAYDSSPPLSLTLTYTYAHTHIYIYITYVHATILCLFLL